MTEKVSIFYADDWVWLFIGDRLVVCDHGVDEGQLLYALGVEFNCAYTCDSMDEDAMIDNLQGAGKLSEVYDGYVEMLRA